MYMSAGVENFVSLIMGACTLSIHDEKLLLQAKHAFSGYRIEGGCSSQYTPSDIELYPLILSAPDIAS